MTKRLLISLMMLLTIVTETKAQDMKTVPLTIEAVTGGWAYFTNEAAGDVIYRVNDGEVQTIPSKHTASLELDPGDKVSFWGDNAKYGDFYKNNSSNIDVDEDETFYVYGNIMSLVSSTDFDKVTTLTEPYAFANLFYGSYVTSHPTNALVLPATTLSDYCYYNMFYACDITNAPALPATTLTEHCYHNMFYRCIGLTAAPALPATTLANECYERMFADCRNLTDVPALLPATTLAKECYSGMFYDCEQLVTPPALPATKLDRWCYSSMFGGCKNLATAPVLEATTLEVDCYKGMFGGCEKLTTAPELPAITLKSGCYSSMFSGCISLAAAPELPATKMEEGCYSSMFYRCKSLIEAPELPATVLAANCYKYMFEDCTSLVTAPALPVMTLAESCYESMFYGCTSLTTAPDLPAPKLVKDCYENMFRDCMSLNSVKCLASDMNAYYCTSGWLDGVCDTGTFTKAHAISWERGENGIPESWTVEETDNMIIEATEIDEDDEEVYPYWTTYYNSAANFEAAPGTMVYTASLNGTNLTFTVVADRIVRAGQAVIMASDNVFITMTPTASTGTDSYYTDNALIGSDTKVPLESKSTYYALADLDYGLGFYKIDQRYIEVIPAHRAYIKLSRAGARFLSIGYGDDTTAIESMEDYRNNKADEVVYDLQGRRMMNPTSGLYIVNGKKTIIK